MSFFPKSQNKRKWSAVFVISFVLGIALICLEYERMVWNTDFLNRSLFEKMTVLDIDSHKFFFYILQRRTEFLFLILLVSAAGGAVAGAVLFFGWSGFLAGIMLAVLAVRFGIRAFPLFCGCVLPQGLFLMLGYLEVWEQCVQKKAKGMLVFSAGMLLMASALEAYIGPGLIKLIFTMFST
ncbi:MAG: hypothetical protein IKC46_05905 [Lachnospiraceae bacterium]|nr:hypothetical protein [Lachnospiraceae bacterium]